VSVVCSKCQAHLNDKAQFCNKCGAPVVRQPRLCSKCGSQQRLEARFCNSCGTPLPPIEVQLVCVHCGRQAQPGARTCSHCGKPVDGQLCRRCGRTNRMSAVFCAHCGTNLQKPLEVFPYQTGKVPINSLLNKRYLVVRLIKQGGMSAIYLVKDTLAQGQLYAAKEMSFSILDEVSDPSAQPYTVQDYKHLFRQEFEILSKANHTNLPRVVDCFEENSRPYFIMEYINGITLEEKLFSYPEGEYLSEQVVLRWTWQICDVLDYLHHCDPPIIYRDLKPSNLMEISGTDEIKLIDFGIARFFKPHQKKDTFILGTPGYAPPELYVRSDRMQTGAYSDIYSLGATLHHLLTRRDPSRQPFEFVPVKLLNPSISQTTSDAIQKAVQYQPELRFQSIFEFLQAVFGPEANFGREPQEPWSIEPPLYSPPATSLNIGPSEPMPVVVMEPKPIAAEEPEITLSDHIVDFGEFSLGNRPTDNILAVTIKAGGVGNAVFDRPWFRAYPTQWNGSQFLQLSIDSGLVPKNKWNKNQPYVHFASAPNFIKSWAGWHAARLVPTETDCSGTLTIQTTKTEERVVLKGKMLPASGQVVKGWSLVIFWMIVEAVVLIGAIGVMLGILLS